MQVDHLVVDSSGFIHNGPIRKTGKAIYSCQEVVDEIKDKATLERLKVLPYELKMIQFDRDDLEFCCEFAKKTGDYRQLSAVDLKLIAATYRLERLHNGDKHINKEPKDIAVKPAPKKKNRPIKSMTETIKSIKEADEEKMDAQDEISSDKIVSDVDMDRILAEEAGPSEEEDEEEEGDNDEQGWITPQNIDKVYARMGRRKPKNVTTPDPLLENRITVACMTSDFSIQNCLLQMGLLVVSPMNGLMIKQAKKIALRCHACFKVFHDPEKVKGSFCPHCGNMDTLKRVQYTIDKNGEKRVIINFKRPIKVKGTNQQLPRPRGGKHANNPILTADQRVRRDKFEKFAVDEKKTVTAEHILNDPAYLVRTNPFAYRSSRLTGKRR